MALRNQNGKLGMAVGLDLNGNRKIEENETILQGAADLFGCAFSHVATSLSPSPQPVVKVFAPACAPPRAWLK